MDDESFERLAARLGYTMFVVTTAADGNASGCLVGFATQTSLEPQRFLVGISKRNHTFGVAARSQHLAVHVLARRSLGLARLFGGQTGDDTDKFQHCSWHTGPAGMPILDDAPAWFVGKTLNRIELGDHLGYLLEPIAGHASRPVEKLLAFSDVGDIEPGHGA
ncbi:oxidoreductase [Mycolicibacter terrae]|uniref:Oxidoreductase n=1 Tax=Mycolicibacter terrae TaxID=1788 RepID=A0AAD1I0Z5_9MYCO|nr:flavin reductase family protein [Mycolicibacter terrae]ORW89369.1 oxidoreductase [Mycolicibacter terrae]BBX21826.1 oxidoreductase [Mycolicibacter terrae]SNV85303.1 oxidoreductase [Mycolicibacter terrae]